MSRAASELQFSYLNVPEEKTICMSNLANPDPQYPLCEASLQLLKMLLTAGLGGGKAGRKGHCRESSGGTGGVREAQGEGQACWVSGIAPPRIV